MAGVSNRSELEDKPTLINDYDESGGSAPMIKHAPSRHPSTNPDPWIYDGFR